MKYRTDVYLALNNGGWIHQIFKKWTINIQHIEKIHEISFCLIMWTNNDPVEGNILINQITHSTNKPTQYLGFSSPVRYAW